MPLNLGTIETDTRIDIVKILQAFCANSQLHSHLCTGLYPIIDGLLSEAYTADDKTLPWIIEYLRDGICELTDVRARILALSGVLPIFAKVIAEQRQWPGCADILHGLRYIPRKHPDLVEVMAQHLFTPILNAMMRDDVHQNVADAATDVLIDMMEVSGKPIAEAPATGRIPSEECKQLLRRFVIPLALNLGRQGFVNPLHARPQWMWLIDMVVPALQRDTVLRIAFCTLKAILLRAGNCSTTHWLAIATAILRMLRFPPADHVMELMEFLEFVAIQRPALYPFLAAYLRGNLRQDYGDKPAYRDIIQRIEQAIVMEAPAPSLEYWLPILFRDMQEE